MKRPANERAWTRWPQALLVCSLTSTVAGLALSNPPNIEESPPAHTLGQPWAEITSPVWRSSYGEGVPITFEGFCTDPEDGEIVGDALLWNSSLDGQIGTGESFTVDDLSLGKHRVELTATDSDGNLDVATRDVTVRTGRLKWKIPLVDTGGVVCAPAIGPDGTIYVSAVVSIYSQGRLFAVNPNGSIKWEFNTGGAAASSPAVGTDETIYVGTDSGTLFAVDGNGNRKWAFGVDGMIRSSPAIADDGTIYVGSRYGGLYAVNPDGSQKWQFAGISAYLTSPAIAHDGTVYAGSYDGGLHAISPDGSSKWEFPTTGIAHSPAIGLDGTIYFASECKLYALDSDGSKQWEFTPGQAECMNQTPAISEDGTLYVEASFDQSASGAPRFYAIHPDGSGWWMYSPQFAWSAFFSPVIGADGTVYFSSKGRDTSTGLWRMYALELDGTYKWHFVADTVLRGSAAIAADGALYVGVYSTYQTDEGGLYALRTESKGLANSPWPTFSHDNRNSGNVHRPTAVSAVVMSLKAESNVDGVRLRWETFHAGSITSLEILRAIGDDHLRRVMAWEGGAASLRGEWTDAEISPGSKYRYQAVAAVGDVLVSSNAVEIRSTAGTVNRAELLACSPNPFNASTRIHFALDYETGVTIRVHDVAGRLVRHLDLGRQPAGEGFALWDGRDGRGREIASGSYLIRLITTNAHDELKVILTK